MPPLSIRFTIIGTINVSLDIPELFSSRPFWSNSFLIYRLLLVSYLYIAA